MIYGVLFVVLVDFDMLMFVGYLMFGVFVVYGWILVLIGLLLFLSIVVVSCNDLFVCFECVEMLVVGWGSWFVDFGEVGYLNLVFGYGEWYDVEWWIGEVVIFCVV